MIKEVKISKNVTESLGITQVRYEEMVDICNDICDKNPRISACIVAMWNDERLSEVEKVCMLVYLGWGLSQSEIKRVLGN